MIEDADGYLLLGEMQTSNDPDLRSARDPNATLAPVSKFPPIDYIER